MTLSPANGGEVLAALDELFGAIDKYRMSQGFQDLLEFLKRLPTVGPYNGLLLHIQRPGATHVATVRGWRQLGREVKREANPLVTLKAFGPVEFVYDILDTTGPDLPPRSLTRFARRGSCRRSSLNGRCGTPSPTASPFGTWTSVGNSPGV